MNPEFTFNENFVDGDYNTSGIAGLFGKKNELIFLNFETEEGPELKVYLATDIESTNFISLGTIKGFKGDFTYTIKNPENINSEMFNCVLIWCVGASSNFGSASLE